MSVYAILGFLAAAILLVVVAHIIALRRYATLFDANSHRGPTPRQDRSRAGSVAATRRSP